MVCIEGQGLLHENGNARRDAEQVGDMTVCFCRDDRSVDGSGVEFVEAGALEAQVMKAAHTVRPNRYCNWFNPIHGLQQVKVTQADRACADNSNSQSHVPRFLLLGRRVQLATPVVCSGHCPTLTMLL
jgi:hypothetical protein